MFWNRFICSKLAPRLAQYTEAPHTLSLTERQAIERHLSTCASCQQEAETMRRVSSVLKANIPLAVAPAPDLWSRLQTQIQAETPARIAPKPTPFWNLPIARVALGTATACALATFVAARFGVNNDTTRPNLAANTQSDKSGRVGASLTTTSVAKVFTTPHPMTSPSAPIASAEETPRLSRPPVVHREPHNEGDINMDAVRAAKAAAAEARQQNGISLPAPNGSAKLASGTIGRSDPFAPVHPLTPAPLPVRKVSTTVPSPFAPLPVPPKTEIAMTTPTPPGIGLSRPTAKVGVDPDAETVYGIRSAPPEPDGKAASDQLSPTEALNKERRQRGLFNSFNTGTARTGTQKKPATQPSPKP